MNLSDNLKKIRKDNNLSQEDLAEKLGVSRQSVSKWESGVAYPEMDKVLELCKLFNLNIDELLNQDIKEIEKNKQSTSNVNKYIDSFLSYISKTVNLFSSLKFKAKIKCLFEQAFIGFILIMIAFIIHEILENIVTSVFSFIPGNALYVMINIFSGIYILFAFICIVAIMFHIFKIRYLDYYVITDKTDEQKNNVEEENIDNEKEELKEEKNDKKEKVKELKRKEEKVIIRDPEHSGYKFIRGLVKVILFFIKLFVFFIGLGFACSLIGLVCALVLSFLISNTGLLFVGILLGLIGAIIINLIILDIIINFIINRKNKKMLLIILFLVSLIMIGVSFGFGLMSYKNFRLVSDFDEKYFVTEEKTIQMNKDLSVIPFYDVEYIESKNNDVKVVYEYANYCDVRFDDSNNEIGFYTDCLSSPDLFRVFLKNLNDKVIADDIMRVKIYTNKNNIKLLQDNQEKKIKEENLREERAREEERRLNEEYEKYLNESYYEE